MIDYWCNAFTPDREQRWRAVIADGDLAIRTRAGDDHDGFASPDTMVERGLMRVAKLSMLGSVVSNASTKAGVNRGPAMLGVCCCVSWRVRACFGAGSAVDCSSSSSSSESSLQTIPVSTESVHVANNASGNDVGACFSCAWKLNACTIASSTATCISM